MWIINTSIKYLEDGRPCCFQCLRQQFTVAITVIGWVSILHIWWDYSAFLLTGVLPSNSTWSERNQQKLKRGETWYTFIWYSWWNGEAPPNAGIQFAYRMTCNLQPTHTSWIFFSTSGINHQGWPWANHLRAGLEVPMLRLGIVSRVGTRGNPTTFGGGENGNHRRGALRIPHHAKRFERAVSLSSSGLPTFPKIESGSVVHGWRLLRWSRRMHVIHRAWIWVVSNHLHFSFYRQTLISCMFVPDISYLHQQAVVRTDWHLQSTYPP